MKNLNCATNLKVHFEKSKTRISKNSTTPQEKILRTQNSPQNENR
jgi:hypothetical protein